LGILGGAWGGPQRGLTIGWMQLGSRTWKCSRPEHTRPKEKITGPQKEVRGGGGVHWPHGLGGLAPGREKTGRTPQTKKAARSASIQEKGRTGTSAKKVLPKS